MSWYCMPHNKISSRTKIRFEFIKGTLYLALMGELWGVYCEDLRENWLCYNGTTLYHNPKSLTGFFVFGGFILSHRLHLKIPNFLLYQMFKQVWFACISNPYTCLTKSFCKTNAAVSIYTWLKGCWYGFLDTGKYWQTTNTVSRYKWLLIMVHNTVKFLYNPSPTFLQNNHNR